MHRSTRRIATWLALAGVIAWGQPATSSASYPGHDGTIAYQLSATWDAGNLGSCDVCSGGLSGLYRLDRHAPGIPIDNCLYSEPPDQMCGAGVPIIQCVWSAPPDQMCDPLHPVFSPDGREMAFSWTGMAPCPNFDGCAPPAAPETIVVANSDGSAQHQLPGLTADDIEPAFLPSGRALVFAGRSVPVSVIKNAPQDLYTVSTDGTGLRRLTYSGASQPAPCANGSIAFVHAGNIYLLSRGGSTQRRLTVRGGERPDCSPSDKEIAFVRHNDVYLINIRDGHVRRLTTRHSVLSGPTFAPDGRDIAFTTDRSTHAKENYCQIAIDSIDYLELINLTGRRQGPLHRIGDNGTDDSDCGGHSTIPGAITWQALSDPYTAAGRQLGYGS